MYTLLDDLIRAFLLCFKSINEGQVDNPMPKKMDLCNKFDRNDSKNRFSDLEVPLRLWKRGGSERFGPE